jgi:uncharacterized protein (TIRG00374 family)
VERGRPGYRRLIISAVIAFIIIALLIILADRKEIGALAGQADWSIVPLAAFFSLLSYLSLSSSFTLIYRIFARTMPVADLLQIGFVSVAISNMVFFGGLPEYTLRVLLMKPRGMTAGEVIVPSILHSYIKDGIYTIGAPIAVFFMLAERLLPSRAATAITLAVFILTFILLLISLAVFYRPVRTRVLTIAGRIWHFFTNRDDRPFFESLDSTGSQALKILRQRPSLILIILALVIADWAAVLVSLYFCFRVVGLAIGPEVLILGYIIGRTAGAISFAPGGAGVQEASMAGLYSLLGEPFAQALIATVVFRLVYYFIPFGVSLFFYRRLVQRALQALE